MNASRLGSMILSCLWACCMTAMATDSPQNAQSYFILIKGEIAGTERVTETRDEAGNLLYDSDHEIYISDGLGVQRMGFVTKMKLAKGNYAPMYYLYKYTSGESGDFYEVTVQDSQIRRKLSRSGHVSYVTSPVRNNTVIIDFNVYHHYNYLVQLYDAAKGGRQLFSNFVPLIGTELPIALTLLGEDELKTEKGSLPVISYKVEFVNMSIAPFSLMVDRQKRLVRLVIPSQELEVLRKDLIQPDRSE